MSTPELKPCPFCGKQGVEFPASFFKFGCPDASCAGYCAGISLHEWNTRHNPAESALNAAREALSDCPIIRLGETLDQFRDRFSQWYREKRNEALAQIDKAFSPQQSKTT